MICRLLEWIAHSHRESVAGADALRDAEKRLAAETERTAAAREVGERARESRRRNNYAAALRAAYHPGRAR